MVDQTARTQAWLADLAAIIDEMEDKAVSPLRVVRKRSRKLKPVWEE